jgi:hypothetical protein
MILNLFLFLFDLLMKAFIAALPTYSLWPQAFLDTINYAISSLGLINFIIPVNSIIICVDILAHFFFYYYLVKLILGIANWIRGSGEIKI